MEKKENGQRTGRARVRMWRAGRVAEAAGRVLWPRPAVVASQWWGCSWISSPLKYEGKETNFQRIIRIGSVRKYCMCYVYSRYGAQW